jgi:hypothetical protein
MTGAGVYVPDSAALRAALARGHGWSLDQARVFLHFVCTNRWMKNVDENGFTRLDSRILRGTWIHPRNFGPLRRFVEEEGILETAPYSVGNFATGFRVAPAFDGPPRREMIEDPRLARKLGDWRESPRVEEEDPELRVVLARRRPLLDHQRSAQYLLSLPPLEESVAAALHSLDESSRKDRNLSHAEIERKRKNLKEHVAYVWQVILNRDYDSIIVDPIGRRVHSLITRTSSHVRPLLRLDGKPVAEVDVANSQPLLLAALFLAQEHGSGGSTRRGRRGGGGEGGGVALPLCGTNALYVVPALHMLYQPDELANYLAVVEAGQLYDVLAADAGINRDQAKKAMFRDVLFGQPYVNGKVTRAFGRRWPSLLAAIREAKRRFGYKVISHALQRLESTIILDHVCPRLLAELPGLSFMTIHDSVLLVAESTEAVRRIMEDEISRFGARAKVKVKEGPATLTDDRREPALCIC